MKLNTEMWYIIGLVIGLAIGLYAGITIGQMIS